MELGKFFKRSIENGVQPYFLFTEDGRPATLDKSQKLSYDMIDRMAMHGSFTMPRTTIHISSKVSQSEILLYFNNRDAYPISGFPRSLVTEVKPRGKLSSEVIQTYGTHSSLSTEASHRIERLPMGWRLLAQQVYAVALENPRPQEHPATVLNCIVR